jgi:diaminopimelate epimerase
VAAAAVARGDSRRDEEILVELPGGALGIVVDGENKVRMRGPAELAFTGELP